MMCAFRYWKSLFAAVIVCAVSALADGDSLAVDAPQSLESNPQESVAIDIDTAQLVNANADNNRQDTLAVDAPAKPRLSYTGASISAIVPGGGQIYHGRYFMGGAFLAAEAGAAGFSIYWWMESDQRKNETASLRDWEARFRDSADARAERGDVAGDSVALYWAGQYSIFADRSEFEARQARFTAYNALAWAVGIHAYSLLDALELDGIAPRGEAKDPTRAGLLAAVPFLGLGQLYNSRPSKAGMMAMTQVSLMVTAINHHRLMNYASGKYNEMRDSSSAQYAYRADENQHMNYWKSRYDNSFSRRNTYLWVALFAYLYSIFDAVVDAHLSDYEAKIYVSPDLAVSADGGYKAGASLNVRF